ncbi:MAG: TonB-dependent receptor [Bacteroidales bacterium]|nr:TonB-dependent receptor [Bacteroidales bacterium]MBQ6878796.1 TonB-dependent receptor [Bacteroidales bacterium]
MRLLKSFAASLAFLLAGFSAFAQNRELSGVVLDATDFPLIGVAVIVDGTTNGVMTADDGTFTLTVPATEVILNVSSLGYETKLVTVPATQDKVTIYLAEDNMMIEETVVVGYGTQKKVNLTGAVGVVDSKQLEDRTSHNLSAMLQGSVPGLNISTSSGNPGSSGSLNIRGIGSIGSGADTTPLVLIDGVEGEIDRVNPADVESISVIKDASAAAVYGARGAFGVILITTKKGSDNEGKATVRYSGRFGWEEPTTSTDYETTGYWSAFIHNMFWKADNANSKYIQYTDYDMQQLLLRINDKTEHPDRPWTVIENRNGKDTYMYYANTDWWHELFVDRHPVQQHQISLSGGSKAVKFYLSGAFDQQTGIVKKNPDVFTKYNLRSKIDFKINKYAKMTNNTSFYSSTYDYPGVGNVENAIAYAANHGLACFPLQNPDGSWIYSTPHLNYKVANGRHIVYGNGYNTNLDRKTDFSNTTELTITPVKQFNIVGNFTYRFHQNRNTNRSTNMVYSDYPGQFGAYTTGAGDNNLYETVQTMNYLAANVFATYEDSFKENHNLKVMAGFNYESYYRKAIDATGYDLITDELSDFNLITTTRQPVLGGGQTIYALAGFFGRINYDYKGRYLLEVSGRYDGTSRFAEGHRFGFFPSASAGWRISEENWFAPAKDVVNNLKLRASFGSLGNQKVTNNAWMRKITFDNFAAYSFDGSAMGRYATISAPNASDLTWETSTQYNAGIDAGMFNDKLMFTVEGFIRDTKGMLQQGVALPGVYGANSPLMNSADLRTSGYELSFSWRDQLDLGGRPFGYSISANLSDNRTIITKYDNPERTFAKDYYEGMELGEIWGFVTDGLFQSDAEAQAYAQQVDLSYITKRLTGGWLAGDLKYVDIDGDGKIGLGSDTVDKPGDRKILGNTNATLQYGFTLAFDYLGFDVSAFFQGTGNHYWYPNGESMAFWGPYSRPYCSFIADDFLDHVWAEDNTDAYFPRPRAYSAYTSGAYLANVNDRYLQNIRYLRFKNLTVGYTVPQNATRKIGIEKVRVYFSGENLAYWSPFKQHSKYIDPEAAFDRKSGGSLTRYNNAFYPWQKTMMFGVDITF